MMLAQQKIVVDLDTPPATFWRPVSIPDPISGAPLRVRFEFKFRDRVESAAFFDRYRKDAEARLQQAEANGANAQVHEADEVGRDVAALRDIATGWNIAADFCDENLRKFFTRYPAAGPVLAAEYRAALTGGLVA